MTVLAVLINKWVFIGIVVLGGAALSIVIWKLVSRGLYVPPTVLFDETKAKINSNEPPQMQDSSEIANRTTGHEK